MINIIGDTVTYGIIDIVNENTDVDKNIIELAKYIDKLEDRIVDLEETVRILYSEKDMNKESED